MYRINFDSSDKERPLTKKIADNDITYDADSGDEETKSQGTKGTVLFYDLTFTVNVVIFMCMWGGGGV